MLEDVLYLNLESSRLYFVPKYPYSNSDFVDDSESFVTSDIICDDLSHVSPTVSFGETVKRI